ncbi:uncharacterized protein V1510DRAFT_420294 [Dipodascopsis tothii]|uniref:uncharacterized protein n=1 Tax=Dipodascopsis tothii TaxID=44089 RepID=UPI0034CFE5D5
MAGYHSERQLKAKIELQCPTCNSTSEHTASSLAVTRGTVLVQCPSCAQNHLIADHLSVSLNRCLLDSDYTNL